MRNLFNPDSALMRFLNRVADVMILNLLFVATALPVVTLGPALTALFYTAMKLGDADFDGVGGNYLRSFRENFRQGMLLGLIWAALVAVFGAWYVVVDNLNISQVVRLVLWALYYLTAFRFALTALYVFAYQARFDDRLAVVLNNSRLMSLAHLPSSLAMAAVVALAVLITVFYPQLVGYGVLWLLLGFGAIAHVNGALLNSIFRTYAPAPTR
ncbi:MAG: YesL family protein [Propionibacteriaceae bacterium]|nr:YesL family protein [Propionibacteriaceae bacterium]